MRAHLVLLALTACGTTPPPSAPAAPQSTPHTELDAMDTRAPVPLQPMMALHQKQQMRDHLKVVEEVVAGVVAEDWAAVEKSAERFGTSPQMAQMCDHMGAGAPGFTEQALDFHKRADAIAEAARAHDGQKVLAATAHTLAACTACHEAWRQDIVSADEWTQRTGATLEHH